MMRHFALGLGMLATVCLLALPQPSTAAAGPCAADKNKFCANVEKKTGAVAKCLKTHEAQLSDACKTQMAKASEVRKACAADIEKVCKGVEPGQGRIALCLKQRESDLSAACNAARKAAHDAGAAKTPPRAAAAGASKAGGK